MPSTEQQAPFEAYLGDEPYIFVSYAHVDSGIVFSDLSWLHESGLRIWYDEGIDPGKEWPDEIAKAIRNSTAFVIFVSQGAVDSDNVRREIDFAIGLKKKFIAVYLKEIELPDGIQFRIGNIQGIKRYNIDRIRYRRALTKVMPFEAWASGPPHVPLPPGTKEANDVFAGGLRKRQPSRGLVTGVLLAVVAFWGLLYVQGHPPIQDGPVQSSSAQKQEQRRTPSTVAPGNATSVANTKAEYSSQDDSGRIGVAGESTTADSFTFRPDDLKGIVCNATENCQVSAGSLLTLKGIRLAPNIGGDESRAIASIPINHKFSNPTNISADFYVKIDPDFQNVASPDQTAATKDCWYDFGFRSFPAPPMTVQYGYFGGHFGWRIATDSAPGYALFEAYSPIGTARHVRLGYDLMTGLDTLEIDDQKVKQVRAPWSRSLDMQTFQFESGTMGLQSLSRMPDAEISDVTIQIR